MIRYFLAALALAASLAQPAVGRAQAPAEAGMIQVDGGQLRYEACGSGKRTLVLLHDGVLAANTWDEVWPRLCRRFRVIRYDRRGVGGSPPARAAYSRVEDLAAVLKQTGTERAMLVASSNGGGLAIDFALKYPQVVERMVLAGPAVEGLAVSEHFKDRSKRALAPIWRLDREGAIMNVISDRYLIAPGNDAARQLFAARLRPNVDNLLRKDPAAPEPPALPRLAGLKIPTLILVGEADIADVQGQAAALEALMPDAKREVLERCGHLMYLERPELFADKVIDFAKG